MDSIVERQAALPMVRTPGGIQGDLAIPVRHRFLQPSFEEMLLPALVERRSIVAGIRFFRRGGEAREKEEQAGEKEFHHGAIQAEIADRVDAGSRGLRLPRLRLPRTPDARADE